MPDKDFLFLHLRDLPYFRALVRAVEASYYQTFDLPAPILDVGCSDGHFASLTFDRKIDVGLDPWTGPIHEAARRGTYSLLVQADGARSPFPDEYFASAFSNSVLEHIPHIDAVLADTVRALKPEAPFYFCVPNHNFLPALSIGRAFDKVDMQYLGDAYRTFFNHISRHYHSDSPLYGMRVLNEMALWWNGGGTTFRPPR